MINELTMLYGPSYPFKSEVSDSGEKARHPLLDSSGIR